MIAHSQLQLRGRQRGIVALLFLLTLTTAALGLFVSSFSSSALQIDRDKQTAAALAQAKEALIGRAASDSNRPGELPCPDQNNDGQLTDPQDYLFGPGIPCVRLVGRLPWKTLDLPDLRDGNGERLWYALSDDFHAGDLSPLNSETAGQLTISGTINLSNVVAILFSAGQLINGQSRSPAIIAPCATTASSIQEDQCAANYLEGENSNADTVYVSSVASPAFNDRLLPLTPDELFTVVERRVAREVEKALNEYYAVTTSPVHRYPKPADFTDATCLGTAPLTSCASSSSTANGGRVPATATPAYDALSILKGGSNWFQQNGWRELVFYAVAPSCVAPNSCSGSLTLNNPAGAPLLNQKAIVVTAGRTIGSQVRTSTPDKLNLANYLEGENLAAPDTAYTNGAFSSTFHDQASSIP